MVNRVQFEIPGVPRNFTNRRDHWGTASKEKASWWATTALFGTALRKKAGWAICQPGDVREVVITCYRVRLMDDDGNCISVKNIRDALQVHTHGKSEIIGGKRMAVAKVGAGLISSDGDPAVKISVTQAKAAHFKDQRVLITVVAPNMGIAP